MDALRDIFCFWGRMVLGVEVGFREGRVVEIGKTLVAEVEHAFGDGGNSGSVEVGLLGEIEHVAAVFAHVGQGEMGVEIAGDHGG